jgi:hypothetical protein
LTFCPATSSASAPKISLFLFTFFIWGIQLIRGKAKLHPLFTKLILIYLGIGLLSLISAVLLTQTIPAEPLHIGKSMLHFLRRLQYFSLFFIFFSGIRSAAHAKKIILLIIISMVAIAIYGYGQKYLYWPVYSTMNREFSKGLRLYLTEHARVPSTFGGHYDAGAYSLLVLSLILSVYYFTKQHWLKIISLLAFVSGLWLLILTSSRTSFIGYLLAVTIIAVLGAFKKGWWWGVSRWFTVISISLFVMLSFSDLSERYTQLLGLNRFRDSFYSTLFEPKVDKPKDYLTLDDLDLVASPSDQPPTPVKPGLPADVYEDIPDVVSVIDDDGNVTQVEQPRTYSDNAYRYGLSAAIRLDALWPQAIAGFMSNPLLGSGYATLNKDSVGHFTEAESTDSDYLRALGETGLLGFISFFGLISALLIVSLKNLKTLKDPLFFALTIGFIAGTLGLLVNAAYIDVFEASKVAQPFWAIAGLIMVLPYLETKSAPKTKAKTKTT